ncbi:transposase [Nocardioides sp. zg-ZUI104]|uniref:transposase n=1 Tax=Nocardioides faecalis TaxID=2803858 RepID=UPI001BCF5C73|nr:transposase [Nocardioides faecalis]MBS4753240.1 transposase [Nocardioides faecalis]
MLFNLPDYEVLEVTRDEGGERTVLIATPIDEAACPDCGVFSSRVHQRTRQQLADVPFDGLVEVVWLKKRWKCVEELCAKTTFTEHTDQVPTRARLTQRLGDAVLEAVAGEVRAIDRIARQFGVSWPTVQRIVDQAASTLAAWRRTRPRLVRQLGIDEHRFRSVRWFRDDTGGWRRIEPWMTTFVDLATGEVIDVVDGRDAAAVATWLAAQPRWWRRRVEVVAIDPSASFRSAVKRALRLDGEEAAGLQCSCRGLVGEVLSRPAAVRASFGNPAKDVHLARGLLHRSCHPPPQQTAPCSCRRPSRTSRGGRTRRETSRIRLSLGIRLQRTQLPGNQSSQLALS